MAGSYIFLILFKTIILTNKYFGYKKYNLKSKYFIPNLIKNSIFNEWALDKYPIPKIRLPMVGGWIRPRQTTKQPKSWQTPTNHWSVAEVMEYRNTPRTATIPYRDWLGP